MGRIHNEAEGGGGDRDDNQFLSPELDPPRGRRRVVQPSPPADRHDVAGLGEDWELPRQPRDTPSTTGPPPGSTPSTSGQQWGAVLIFWVAGNFLGCG
ncbi:hypothetical protein KSP40_PGU003656 [Platanthera guangdongensis]|uniref:Uncharacterized protein n=1 Tax=Platanthera guangdongensis TaxID=2320717 RepID=A0ABR2MIK0_9ASPA